MDDRQRLEAIVSVINKYLPPDGIPINDAMSEIISLVDPLPAPQPEQEPVAFLDWYENAIWGNEDFQDGCHRAWDAALEHTIPPQREWVGLTDEEIKEIIGAWGDTPVKGYTRKLFDQIEAKLRSKNNG